MTSAAGDYIGGGANWAYVAPAASFSVNQRSAEYLSVSVDSGTDFWTVDLRAPAGETLHPGRYRDAERASFTTGRSPGLDVSGVGRGCNQVWGSFDVDQIATDASGAVTMLEASFVQRCESATAPALKGNLYLDARPLSYRFTSDAGDYIGGGRTATYPGATSIVTVHGSTAGLSAQVSGQRDDWNVSIGAPAGQTLKKGTFAANRFGTDGLGGLDVSGDGRGCNETTGTVTIRDIRFDAEGSVSAVDASFVQHCEGQAPALRGTLRYLDGAFPAPPVVTAPAQAAPASHTVVRLGPAPVTRRTAVGAGR